MTNKETQQIGRLSGQVEMLVKSVDALHFKFDTFKDNCGPCKKEILEMAEKTARGITITRTQSIERWVTRGIISALVVICGYLFLNHFMPDVVNRTAKAEIKASEKK